MVQTKVLTFEYDSPWELVILSYEDKFWNIPNPQLPELVECQFSDYQLDKKNHKLKFKRWGKFSMKLPAWLLKMMGVDFLILTSETTIDRKNRTLVTVGKNESFRNRIEMDEITTFKPHPDDPLNKTLLILEGSLTVNAWGVSSAIETIVISAYVSLTTKGREIEKPMIAKLKNEHQNRAPPLTRSEQASLEMAKVKPDNYCGYIVGQTYSDAEIYKTNNFEQLEISKH